MPHSKAEQEIRRAIRECDGYYREQDRTARIIGLGMSDPTEQINQKIQEANDVRSDDKDRV